MSDHKKTALVLGAGGFIGSHMVRRLKYFAWLHRMGGEYDESQTS